MWERIERVAQPETEPLSLAEVKQQCRVDTVVTDDDAFLTRCIRAAREAIEGPDGRGLAIMAADWRLTLDCFPKEVRIPMGPVLSIVNIVYVDGAGAAQTLDPADYHWRPGRYEARIQPAYGKAWPAARSQLDAVTITFKAGFKGTEEDPIKLGNIPEPLRVAMMMLIAHWYMVRSTTVVGTVPTEIQHGFEDIMNMFAVGHVA
ncbi:head-tail connector protein [Mesorhizobium sp. ASY16-5R]|uniref:head-tail connector protein n=1 Tax=Mesorhizobium sp. ASY16-5R TaxID=3445772 RepID=UPI003F9F314A